MTTSSSLAVRGLALLSIALLCACSQPPQPKLGPDQDSERAAGPAAHLQHSLEQGKAVAARLEGQAQQQRQAIDASASGTSGREN